MLKVQIKMKLPKYKAIFWILLCMIILELSVIHINSGFTFIKFPWRSTRTSSLLSTVNKTLFRQKTNKESANYQKVATTTNVEEVCHEMYENYTGKQNTYEHQKLRFKESIYYCKILKCGTTFMSAFLSRYTVQNNSNVSRNFVKEEKQQQNISDVFAFTFVREPYGRLFSAYENKLFHPNNFWRKLGKGVINEVRQNASELSKHVGHDVTFTEFIEYVVKSSEQGRKLNPHLAAMHTMCNPCKRQYDYVGHIETMTQDLVYLVDEWKTRGIVSKSAIDTEKIESEIKYKRSLGPISHMFWALGQYGHLLSKYKLFQRTWSSYQIRGMILKNLTMPFDENNVRRVGIQSYTQAVKSAMSISEKYGLALKYQRKEVLLQAYNTLPEELMTKLSKFVKPDCLLFGYDEKPDYLFKKSSTATAGGHDYFKGL